MRKEKRARRPAPGSSPVMMFEGELAALRRDLRRTLKAYAHRLEADLQSTAIIVSALPPAEQLSTEHLHELREMTILLRRRKLKPEKGRRKDLRKIDSLIEDLQLFVPANGHARERNERLL